MNTSQKFKKNIEIIDKDSLSTLRNTILDIIRSELPSIIGDIISKKLQPLIEDITEVKKALEATRQECSNFHKRLDGLQTLATEHSKKITQLETRINDLERAQQQQQQWARLQNLEIVGVPESSEESLVEIVGTLAKYSGLILKSEDIDFVHRVQPQRPSSGRPRSIVVRLRTRLLKDKFLSSARKLRGASSKEIGLSNNSGNRIYVNEHLTQLNKRLLKSVKVKAKETNFSYVWTRNCRIYMRKNDKSQPLLISTEADLKKIQ